MDYVDCYRVLGLRSGASFADIKSSYRRLAQQYHPDINPHDNKAKEKFIALTVAYKVLLQVVAPVPVQPQPTQSPPAQEQEKPQTQTQQTKTQQTATKPPPQEQEKVKPKPPNLIEIERRLKWKTYDQLQRFLRERRFPQAIALAEALAERLPEDAEVRQWQAISYQFWGRALIVEKQWLKARIYLKKAIKTDPNNKSLYDEVQRDFKKLEQIF